MSDSNMPQSQSGSAVVQQAVRPGPITSSITIFQNQDPEPSGSNPTLVLKLNKPPRSDKKVDFKAGTVDNENMNKKKSKCCCIYKKPHVFGESSSDTDDECDHCSGHAEKKKGKNKGQGPNQEDGPEPADPVPA